MAAKAHELLSHDRVVLVQQGEPITVTKCDRLLRRSDDIGEQCSGKQSIGLGEGTRPGQKRLDLFDQTVAVAGERRVVDAAELEVPCPGMCSAR